MLRQILVVALGIVLGYVLAAAVGYIFYFRVTHIFPHEAILGRFARYIVNPAMAFLVGACVGALAKSRPEVLAALSLTPSALGTLLFRRLDASQLLILIFLELVCLFIGVGVARLSFRSRTRSTST